MANFNSVVLLGNLTRDPELRSTPDGVPVATFAVAVNRQTKEGGAKGVAFVDIEAWGRLAEISAAHLKRGRQILIQGELRQGRWVDEASKKNRSKLYVVAGTLQFLGGKGTEGIVPSPEEVAQAEK